MANFLIFVVLNLFAFSSAFLASFNSSQLTNRTKLYNESKPPLVHYDGAQLWAVDVSDQQTKNLVFGLEKDFGKQLERVS